MSLRLAAFALLACLFALAACTSSVPRTSDKDVVVVDHEQLVRLLTDKREITLVIDVRSPEQYAAGHLPMAVNIPFTQLGPGDPRLAEVQNIVVYGRGLGDPLSRAAAKRMLVQGYTNVYDFAGGLDLWKRMGGQVVTGGE